MTKKLTAGTLNVEPVPTVIAVKAEPVWVAKERNGVKEYRPKTTGAKVWAIADKHVTGKLLDVAAVVAEGMKADIKKGSINAALVQYRKHHGVTSKPLVKLAAVPKPVLMAKAK